MEDMKAKCIKGNPGVRLCATPSCQVPGVICGGDCQCSHPHKSCMRNTTIESVMLHMDKKGQTLKPVFLAVSQWCEGYIKELENIVCEMKNKIDNPKNSLKGNEGKLFRCLKYGNNEDIKGSLVNYAICAMQVNPTFQVQYNSQTIRQNLLNISKQMQIITSLTKQVSKYQKYINGDNIYLLEKQNGFLVSDIGLYNSCLQNYSKLWNVALLKCSVEQFSSGNITQTYKFKINKISESKNIIFGLHHLSFAFKNSFKGAFKNNNGVYGINALDGNLIIHQNDQPERKQNEIVTMDVNDVIHLKFNLNDKKLQIINVTKNQKDIIQTQIKQNDSLHIFVGMKNEGDQVQYLGMDLQKQ